MLVQGPVLRNPSLPAYIFLHHSYENTRMGGTAQNCHPRLSPITLFMVPYGSPSVPSALTIFQAFRCPRPLGQNYFGKNDSCLVDVLGIAAQGQTWTNSALKGGEKIFILSWFKAHQHKNTWEHPRLPVGPGLVGNGVSAAASA